LIPISLALLEMQFNMPEFSESKQVQWNFHVLPEKTSLPYDMIIGRDLMRKLKMDVLYSSEAIVWDGLRLPMQEVKNNFMDFNAIIEDTTESDSVKEQMNRMNRILDANYEKPDLKTEVAKMTHLRETFYKDACKNRIWFGRLSILRNRCGPLIYWESWYKL
jgi:hypothetical protein